MDLHQSHLLLQLQFLEQGLPAVQMTVVFMVALVVMGVLIKVQVVILEIQVLAVL